jgi:hypothetical protein
VNEHGMKALGVLAGITFSFELGEEHVVPPRPRPPGFGKGGPSPGYRTREVRLTSGSHRTTSEMNADLGPDQVATTVTAMARTHIELLLRRAMQPARDEAPETERQPERQPEAPDA